MAVAANSLSALNARIIECDRCPRLRVYCAEIARVKRRAYLDSTYWGRPVPSFGDPDARVLVLGLAPGAHGSNRTGRPFTGDGSGSFLYPVLHETGFASQPSAASRDDGMSLTGLWISAVVRCAPPGNKPTPGEQRNCAPWLDQEIALLQKLRVVVCLGKIAFDGFLSHQQRAGQITTRAGFEFRHGAEYSLNSGLKLIGSYHPSLQNTNTGKLTRAMFLSVFERARAIGGLD
jgi:uracil-DNA glycosylase family 4